MEVVIVRMPKRGGGHHERLAVVLNNYPALKRVRVQFCDDGQRAHVVPQSVSAVLAARHEVATP